ncbi:GLPGLI family protein [Flavobacteriaceae bacterium MAR_2010_72]|nr:GLPGLI family protein [Flavobacteriaceae bacterium MAR_2010_72]TVZ58712.1 GLPGLI family protein [Flavobacteriaceae bacterium MAR_2010_105]
MKSIYFKLSIALIFISGQALYSQDFQGVAYYQSKTTMDMDGFGGRQMSEEQKRQIAERMKSMFEKTYVLTFNRAESIYKEEEKLETPGAGGGMRFGGFMSSFTGGPQYKNVKESQLLQEQEFFGKQFLVTDSLPPLNWKMESETKQIGQYLCFKATAIKQVDEMDMTSFRRRNRDNEEKKEGEEKADTTKTNNPIAEVEVPKQIIVTAWYTPQIPINQGPGEYWGLPGLILEVNADRTTILCSKIVINPQEKQEIKRPSKGKSVTRDEYNAIMKEKIEEMRENFGGRDRGNFRRN